MITSRLITTTVNQCGTTPISASTTNAERISILSASGSMYAPSVVRVFVSRAIAPSTESVIPASTKVTSAAPTRPSVRKIKKIGMAMILRSVRKFGRFSTTQPPPIDARNANRSAVASRPKGGVLTRRRGCPHQRLELPALVHVADDVATADELPVDVDLRDRRPVRERLHTF